MVRSTPHPSTKKTPAELLFGRKIRTRLPHTPSNTIRPDIAEAVREDRKAKERQSKYKNKKNYVKHHNITVGNQVLLKQRSTKHKPPYDPIPYNVTEVHGHQVKANREHQVKVRDAQKWKKIITKPPTNYDKIRQHQIEKKLQHHYQWI